MCEEEGGPVIVPYVKFPEEKKQPGDWSWNCKCLESFKSRRVDLLLYPEVTVHTDRGSIPYSLLMQHTPDSFIYLLTFSVPRRRSLKQFFSH